jgi:hypothetical protein
MEVKFFKLPIQKNKLLIKSETIKQQFRTQIGKSKRAQIQKLHDADKIELHMTQQNKERSFGMQIEE